MNSLKVLEDNKCALLLVEIGCWLHMLGKFHEKFLEGDYDLDIEILERLESRYKIFRDLLTGNAQKPTWTSNIWKTLPGIQINDNTCISTFIKKHRDPTNTSADTLEKLLIDAHGRSSWVEKGILERFQPSQQKNVYLSTAFGFEKKCISLSEIKSERDNLYKALEAFLEELRRNTNPVSGWSEFCQNFIEIITGYFIKTVGDTRRPSNDVTLFDQTAASVASFKASLAQILLEGYDPSISKYYWRFLRVGVNGPAFWSKSLRITDILARQDLVKSALDRIREVVEIEYPLGYEIYRDENGSVFVFPDVENILDYEVKDNETLQEKLRRIFREYTRGEAEILLNLTEKTRNMLSFGKIIEDDVPELNTSSDCLKKQWDGVENREICTVCGLRPQGGKQKSIARSVCDVCEERRSDRSQRWAEKMNFTIWIDEICDKNGRIALIVGKFMLKEWLTGMLLNSIMAFDPETRQLTDRKRGNIQYKFDYCDLVCDISEALKSNQTLGKKFKLLDNLILKRHRDIFSKFRDIYDFYVEDSDLDSSSADEKWLFALLMLRQSPSPSRIRRIWETTRQFWQDILPTDEDEITQSETRGVLGIVGPRILIKGDITSADRLPAPYHAYEIVLDEPEMRISVVWDEKRLGFITVENLDYVETLLGKSFVQKIKGKILKIEEPVGYGTGNKEWGSINVEEVTEIPKSEYVPAIPLLAEPSTFMALLPADKALDLVKRIREKYEREMGKVKNRLPLMLGVIFTHRYTPLRVILDAGQRMVNEFPHTVLWEVRNTSVSSNSHDPHFYETAQICIQNNDDKATWNVPVLMGDGKTEDNWYPYVFLRDWRNNQHPETRKRSLKVVCPYDRVTWLVHAKDICLGDTVYFTPSLFDFEWLDTNSRRFEIAYDQGKRLGEKGIRRPYLLDSIDELEKIWNTLKKTATTSQIHALRNTVEQKRREWNITKENENVFWQFCRDTLAALEWTENPWEKDVKKWLDEWADYAVKGWLSDAIELHMQIMKEKSEIGGVTRES